MELDAFEFVPAVADTHDDAIIGLRGDGELARQRLALDDERGIARGGEGIGKLAEDALGVVVNLAGFAVEELRSANDFSSEGRANGLMPEAHAEHGKFAREALDPLDADP